MRSNIKFGSINFNKQGEKKAQDWKCTVKGNTHTHTHISENTNKDAH